MSITTVRSRVLRIVIYVIAVLVAYTWASTGGKSCLVYEASNGHMVEDCR